MPLTRVWSENSVPSEPAAGHRGETARGADWQITRVAAAPAVAGVSPSIMPAAKRSRTRYNHYAPLQIRPESPDTEGPDERWNEQMLSRNCRSKRKWAVVLNSGPNDAKTEKEL